MGKKKVSRDTTDNGSPKTDLSESERRYRVLVEMSTDGVAIVQSDRMIYFNNTMVERTGYTRQELQDLPFHDFIHPDDRAMVLDQYRQGIDEQVTSGTLEFRALMKDGTSIHTEINAVRTEWGGSPAVLCFFRDITGRKAAERALAESEERYRDLVENIEDIIYIMDDEGRFIFTNKAMEKFSGMAREELLNFNYRDIITRESLKKANEIFRRQLAGQDVGAFEADFRNKKGEIITLEAHERLIWKGGRVVEVHGIGRDVTERKRTETALRESEERWRSLFENSIEAAFITDIKGTLTAANKTMHLLLGYGPNELIGLSYKKFMNPQAAKRGFEYFNRLYKTGEPITNLVYALQKRDGQLITVEAYVSLMKKGDDIIGFQGTFRDITERIKTQEAIIARERDLNNVFEFTGTATIIVEEDETISKCNHEFEKLSGYRREEIEGKVSWTVFVHPEDVDRVKHFHRTRRESGPAVPTSYEFRLIDKSGIIKQIYLTAGFIPETRQSVAALLDISDRKRSEDALKQSEETFRNLFDTSKDVIFLSTTSGWFYDINRAGEELFGYTRDELLSLDIQDIYKDRRDRQRFQKAIEELGFVKDHEVTFKRKDGALADCLITATLRTDRDGNVIGYQGIIKDISERKKLGEQLAAAAKMEAVGTLAGGMAHNFNNILVGIMGYSEFLLGKKHQDDPDYKALKMIYEGTIRASKLTRELLSIARGGEYNLVKFSLNTLIEKFLPLITGTFDKSIEINTYIAADLPIIEGDMSQVEQCLLNLCINARDAMPKGGKLVIETHHQRVDEDFVRTHLDARIGDYVVLSVTDTGSGIDREDLPHIFEPFFTTKEQRRGSGLGLSTVWGIMKNHKGLITVYSESNEGTTFKLYFPALAEAAAESASPEWVGETIGNETILLIDDEPTVREMWGDALADEGYRVITAEDGLQGIDIFRREKDAIDLIILDFIMPKLGGKETFVMIREIRPDVKVVISSGYSTNGRVKDAIGEDADGFIQKPCQLRHLAEKVRDVLKTK